MYLPDNRRRESLSSLKDRIERRVKQQRDFIVPCGNLVIGMEDRKIQVTSTHGVFSGTDTFLPTLARMLSIPADYLANTMESNPNLALHILNETISAESRGRNIMLRTETPVSGPATAYAVLSDSYNRLDHHLTILPALETVADSSAEVRYSETEHGLIVDYLFADEDSRLEAIPGDVTRFGIRLFNSQAGYGAFHLHMYAERLICSNGMTVKEKATELHRRHRGSRLPIGELPPPADFVSEERVRKMIQVAIQRRDATAELLRQSPQVSLKQVEPKGLKDALLRVDILKSESEKILKHYQELGDLSLYGLIQATTDIAKFYSSTRRVDIEEAASKLLKFKPTTVVLN